jgi:molybdate transport system substrate-binding protein
MLRVACFESPSKIKLEHQSEEGINDMKKYALSLAMVLAFALGGSYSARAQTEVTVIAPGSTRSALDKLVQSFESKTGYKVKETTGTGLVTKKQVIQGDAFDVVIVQPPLQEVIASGNVVSGSETTLASVAVGVVVRKGAPKPDISTPEAVKRMFLAAKSITYPDPAGGSASGTSSTETLRKLGVFEQVQPKIKLAPSGAIAMATVAKGEVEIDLSFLSEVSDPGVDLVGPLPEEVSTPTRFLGFVSSHAKDPAAAKALLDYLSSPDAAPLYTAQGFKPGH